VPWLSGNRLVEDVREPISLRARTTPTSFGPAQVEAMVADCEAGAMVKDLAKKYGAHRSTMRSM
jgi:hypothetical protein